MLAVANRKYDELHKDQPWHDGAEALWSETYSPLTPWHFRDGVTLYLAETDENPDDNFLSERVSAFESHSEDLDVSGRPESG